MDNQNVSSPQGREEWDCRLNELKTQFTTYMDGYKKKCEVEKVQKNREEAVRKIGKTVKLEKLEKIADDVKASKDYTLEKFEMGLEENKRKSQDRKAMLTIGIIVGVILLLLCTVLFKGIGVLEKQAHSTSFRWGVIALYFWFATILSGIVIIIECLFVAGKKDAYARDKWKHKLFFWGSAPCLFAIVVVVGILRTIAKWGWKNETIPTPGRALENFSEWGYACIPALIIVGIFFVAWYFISKKELVRTRLNISEMSIFASTGYELDKRTVKDYFDEKKQIEDDENRIQQQWNEINKLVDQWFEDNGYNENNENKSFTKIFTRDLTEELYISVWNNEESKKEKKYSEITKIECKRKPIQFIYDGSETFDDTQKINDLLRKLAVAVTDAFRICHPNKENLDVCVLDFVDNVSKFEKDNKIKKWRNIKLYGEDRKDTLYDELTKVIDQYNATMGKNAQTVAESNNAEDKEYADQMKKFYVVQFIMEVTNGLHDKDCLEEKWWKQIIENTYMNGILPIFYIEKRDWEKKKEMYQKKLGDEIWYVRIKNNEFSLEKYNY